MKEKTLKIFVTLSFFVLFATFFYLYLCMPLWDYDFWWHIATGRYIVTEHHLPQQDPFSFTSAIDENRNIFPERENFLLKQYWLAQIILYLVFQYSGATGVILLRAIILLLTSLFVLWQFRRSGVNFYISFVFTFLLLMMTTKSLGERPVLFSLLFTAITLFLLMDFREKRHKTIFFLIPVILLWANMHGGFILGVIIILAFICGEAVRLLLKKSPLSKQERVIFFAATGMALISSFLNPTGWDAFWIAFSPKYKIFLQGIQEYESPLFFYLTKLRSFDYQYFSMVFFAGLLFILRNRKLDLVNAILLAGFLLMSLQATRYGTFFAIVGSLIMGKEYHALLKNVMEQGISELMYRRLKVGFAAAALLSAVLFTLGYVKDNRIQLGMINLAVTPKGAVDFIEKNNLAGNMFNDYGYGGYISWRLYPRKNFIDTRALNRTVMNEYRWISEVKKEMQGIRTTNENKPLWETLLDHYRIAYAVVPWLSIYGDVYPLILELNQSDRWRPVYFDHMGIIFVRNIPEHADVISKYATSEDIVLNALIYKCSSLASSDTLNPRYLISLGYIFNKAGRYEDAVKAYRYAFSRMKDPDLEKRIREIDEKIEEQNRLNSQDININSKT